MHLPDGYLKNHKVPSCTGEEEAEGQGAWAVAVPSMGAPRFAVKSLGAVRGLYCLYDVRHVLDPTIWMQGLYFKRVQILLPTMCRRKFTTSDRLCSYMWFSVKRWVFHFARYISVLCFSCFIPTLICEQTVVGAV